MHEQARAWFEEVLSGTEAVGFAWTVLIGFARISTNPQIYRQPLSSRDAVDLIDDWLAQPVVKVVEPTIRHASILRELLESVEISSATRTSRRWRSSTAPSCIRVTTTSPVSAVCAGSTRSPEHRFFVHSPIFGMRDRQAPSDGGNAPRA
jgi:hypothetical protein